MIIVIGAGVASVLVFSQMKAKNQQNEKVMWERIYGDISAADGQMISDFNDQDLKKISTFHPLFINAKSYEDVLAISSNITKDEKKELISNLQATSNSISSEAKQFGIISNVSVLVLFVFGMIMLAMKTRKLSKNLDETKGRLSELTKRRKKLNTLLSSYDAKLKSSYVRITNLEEERERLTKKIDESKTLQQEMKGFIDTQIKTNEQLMIAESKLKSLLEKEKESKAILNQTLDRLKDTQGQLVHSEKMASLGQLTAGIAHEINNPINFVFNGIDSLRRNLEDLDTILTKYDILDKELADHATIKEIEEIKVEVDYEDLKKDLTSLVFDIKEGAVRTIEIVKGLRVFSRLDEEDMKDANINECLDATLVLLKNKTKDNIQVVKEYDDALPEILCYPGQLNQVFMNIISNAIQAIPEDRDNAEIKVATRITDGGISISLKDNGTGISDEVKERIFEPFFTTKPVGVGTGLGLSISYGIIEKHHGSLQVESELGKGTEFIINLPKSVPQTLSAAS
ncbi:MAG: ATP-binding protein [Bacteroidota bacterium]